MCEGLGVKVAGFKVQGLLRSSWDLVIGVISKVTGLRTAKHPIKVQLYLLSPMNLEVRFRVGRKSRSFCSKNMDASSVYVFLAMRI